MKSIRPSKGEIQRIRDEQGLIDEPPREVDMVAPDKAPKRYVIISTLIKIKLIPRGKGATEKSRILMLRKSGLD